MSDAGLILLLFIAIVFGALILRPFMTYFLFNAIMGLIILILANAVAGLGIGYSWLVVLICGIGGVFGAFLVILLHFLGSGI